MSKQSGLMSFFKPKADGGAAASTKPSMLTAGADVLHRASSKVGKITKLARNAKGFVEAFVTLADGVVVTGSPTLGKDFDRAKDGALKQASAAHAASSLKDDPQDEDDDNIDLEEIQRLEDAAFRDRDARRASSEGTLNPPNLSPADSGLNMLSPPTIKKRDAALDETSQRPTQLQKLSLPSVAPKTASAPAHFLQQASNSSKNLLQKPKNAANTSTSSAPQGFWWFLEERHVRDADRRRPDDADYCPSTVFVPSNTFASMTDFQKQYWAIKRVNFDMLILAKLGKFYELYENDAEIAHRLLGLNYTHGGRTADLTSKKMLCAGVPENSIDGIVGKLVALGYKVGIVEEMERAADVKKAQAASSSARKVVDRSLRRIFTPGAESEERGDREGERDGGECSKQTHTKA
jgi:DNA mismatch repair protein MSH6